MLMCSVKFRDNTSLLVLFLSRGRQAQPNGDTTLLDYVHPRRSLHIHRHVASTLPSHRSDRCEILTGLASPSSLFLSRLDSTRRRATPLAAPRRASLVSTAICCREAYAMCWHLQPGPHPIQSSPRRTQETESPPPTIDLFPRTKPQRKILCPPGNCITPRKTKPENDTRLRTKVEIRKASCGPQNN
jgi:hypothetical protein